MSFVCGSITRLSRKKIYSKNESASCPRHIQSIAGMIVGHLFINTRGIEWLQARDSEDVGCSRRIISGREIKYFEE